MRIGNTTITACYVGNQPVQRIYLGNNQIYPIGGWTPAQISSSNLRLWFDASDASTLTLSGTTITQLRDKSGNAFHAASPTGFECSLVANDLNGKATINTNFRRYLTGNTSITGTDRIGIHVIARLAPDTPWARLISLFRGSGTSDGSTDLRDWSSCQTIAAMIRTGDGNATTNNLTGYRGGQEFNRLTAPIDSWAIFSHRIGGNGGEMMVNAATASQSAICSGTNFNINGFMLGMSPDNLAIGVSGWLNGGIAEVVVETSGTLDISQRCQGYLAHKWGMAANLASAHPYRNSPPV